MAQPPSYARQYSFRAFQTANPDDPLPGQKVDIELNAVKTTVDAILVNLALIQRDDGRVANNSIGTSQLDGALISLGFERPTAWATTTSYSVDDAVFQDSKLYLCLVAHTSGVFSTDLAASKWEEVIDFTTIVTDAEAARDLAEGYAADAQAAKTAAEAAAADVAGSATTWLGDTSGTNNYTLTPNSYTPAVRADGFKARFRVTVANTGAVNMTVTGYADDDVKNPDDSELVSGDWPINTIQEITWNATKGWYTWDSGMLAARLKANNTLTGANLFTGAVEFDAGVQMDAAFVANSTTALNGALTVGAAAEFNADLKADSTLSMLLGPVITPGGRLAAATSSPLPPVPYADVTSATRVYYTPYLHSMISLFDGTRWVAQSFSELSQTLADATKSPAAAAINSAYDMFVWNDAGTVRCTRGPAWSSSTSRGTGAGTTDIERVNGVLMNKWAITNGPAANRGVYVGTIATNGTGANGEMSMMLSPSPAAGGTNNRLDVWNMYNRVAIRSTVRDSTDTWSYGTATWRSSNNSTSNRVTFICGLNEPLVSAVAVQSGSSAASGGGFQVGIGIDSTSANHGLSSVAYTSGSGGQMGGVSHLSSVPGVGAHYLQMLERGNGTSCDFFGDNSDATAYQSGMTVTLML